LRAKSAVLSSLADAILAPWPLTREPVERRYREIYPRLAERPAS
jgi:hypothetical protein